MERLTGLQLIAHNQRNSDYPSRSELIRAAGYTRLRKDGTEGIAFTAYYEALLEVKAWEARRQTLEAANRNPSGSYAIRNLIAAIRHQNQHDYRTDSVVRTNASHYRNYDDVDLNIYHCNKLIAAVDFKRQIVVLRINEGSRSDKERLNRILMHFCGVYLFSKNRVWQYGDAFHEIPVKGYWTEVPFWSSSEFEN